MEKGARCRVTFIYPKAWASAARVVARRSIACGGVAVYPGDVIVGDCDGVVVIPPDLADEIAAEAIATTLYDEFAEQEVARGRSLIGLFPAANDEAKRDFEAWKKARGMG